MRIFVTGGAGFIGSNLTERLVAEGHGVTVYDDLSAGSREFLRECEKSAQFRFVEADLLDLPKLTKAIEGHEAVFHLAANSDITESRRQSDLDLRQGTLATYNVLEAMRRTGVSRFVFSSSSVVYGEPSVVPTPENYGPLFPISLYGASKLACEGLISAFCHNYGLQAWIFRFANICGRHGTHGVIVDFIHKLQKNSRQLEILGDGQQAKPYLHVQECVDGILFGWRHASEQLNCFNLGCEGNTAVSKIAKMLLATMKLPGVELIYTGGKRGWVGDVPQVSLDCGKLERLGWKASMKSDEAVQRAVEELTGELECKPSS
ncbi:MAG TPA: SDR family NAD(P)-dependent oxidoreductase [Candidatus Acidoferrales bacterium]|nr:SDR family NAD(P)-dependent oxidoreductase [Candidatus Acidoferrales bacterium]